jgi:hypothetical protein
VGAVGSGPTTSGNTGLIIGILSGLFALIAIGVAMCCILVGRKDDESPPDNTYETETEIAEEPLDQESFSLTAEDLMYGSAHADQGFGLSDVFGQNPEEINLFF